MAKAAPAAAPAEGEAPPKKKSKLLLIIILAVVVLALAGGGAFFFLKKSHGDAEGEDGGDQKEKPAKVAKKHKAEPGKPPTFVPLEPFTVRLFGEGEQYIQLTISLQVDDPHVADQIKAFTPKIRDRINKLLMQTKAASLNSSEGLDTLSSDIKDEINAVVGTPGGTDKKGRKIPPEGPVEEVLLSNIITQ